MNDRLNALVDLVGGFDSSAAALWRLGGRVRNDPDLKISLSTIDTTVVDGRAQASFTATIGTTTDLGCGRFSARTEASAVDSSVPSPSPTVLPTVSLQVAVVDEAFDLLVGHLMDALVELEIDPAVVDEAVANVAAARSLVVHRGT